MTIVEKQAKIPQYRLNELPIGTYFQLINPFGVNKGLCLRLGYNEDNCELIDYYNFEKECFCTLEETTEVICVDSKQITITIESR